MTSIEIKINTASWQVNIGNCDDRIDYLNSEIRINSKQRDRHKRLGNYLKKAVELEYEDEIEIADKLDIMNVVDRLLSVTEIEI